MTHFITPKPSSITWSATEIAATSAPRPFQLTTDPLTIVITPGRTIKVDTGYTTGKYYAEMHCPAASTGIESEGSRSPGRFGMVRAGFPRDSYLGAGPSNVGLGYSPNGSLNGNAYGDPYEFSDIVGIMMNLDDGELSFSVNGVDQGVGFSFTPGDEWSLACGNSSGSSQQGMIVHLKATAATVSYAPPAGYSFYDPAT